MDQKCSENLKTQAYYSKLEGEQGLYEDSSGVLRCKERIDNSDLPYETKRPALLPRNHYISSLFVRQDHERLQVRSNSSSAEEKGLDCEIETVC